MHMCMHFYPIIHCSGADTRAYDYRDRNPFMLAVEQGPSHLDVAKAMMKRDPTLVSLKLESGMTVIHWALEEGHDRNAFFKVVCFLYLN